MPLYSRLCDVALVVNAADEAVKGTAYSVPPILEEKSDDADTFGDPACSVKSSSLGLLNLGSEEKELTLYVG